MVGPPAQPHSLQVSADKSLIGLGLEQVHVYDVHSGQLLSKVPGRQVSFSPDSKTLIAAGGQNGRSVAGIYDARSGKLLVQLAPPSGSLITAVTFSPDGQTVLAGDEAGFVRAWAADSGERLPELAPAPVNE
jgi:WD40 repeat protein